MLPDTITLTDNAEVDRTFSRVSQDGMNSVRREDTAGVDSAIQSQFVIKHTLDPKAKNKPNRHLIAASRAYTDPTTGVEQSVQVHMVITRGKIVPDAIVLDTAHMVADFVINTAMGSVAKILNGGN